MLARVLSWLALLARSDAAKDVEILTLLASQAAVAIENARLYETIRANEDRLEKEIRFAQRVQAALLPVELPKRMKNVDVAARLAPARGLGFTIPVEAATHVHFDGARLRSARALRNLVRLIEVWAPALKSLVGTNPRCRRLGGWPASLRTTVEAAGFADLPWEAAKERLAAVNAAARSEAPPADKAAPKKAAPEKTAPRNAPPGGTK